MEECLVLQSSWQKLSMMKMYDENMGIHMLLYEHHLKIPILEILQLLAKKIGANEDLMTPQYIQIWFQGQIELLLQLFRMEQKKLFIQMDNLL